MKEKPDSYAAIRKARDAYYKAAAELEELLPKTIEIPLDEWRKLPASIRDRIEKNTQERPPFGGS